MSAEEGLAQYERPDGGRLGAWVKDVAIGSPADDAGILPGMRIDMVSGMRPRDVIDWMWEACDDEVGLVVFDPTDSTSAEATLFREPGQDWGITFEDVLFDGIMTCANRCTFCFMAMLPESMRSSLYLRDDDYRLSFLQGNFVTLTNCEDDDVERIVSHRLEPMNVSLHAVSHDARRRLMGLNEARGMSALERLCEAGIEVHAQVVCCPGINDGDELRRTLDWVRDHENVTSLAVVPLGYTRFSKDFSSSFSEDPQAARAVIEMIRPYQRESRERTGLTKFQVSDEFYLDAEVEVPPASDYDGYPQFYDGIGMLRSFMDDVDGLVRVRRDDLDLVSETLESRGIDVDFVCGFAAAGVLERMVGMMPFAQRAHVLPIKNDYFGGDVNVTGLIVACDLLTQLPCDLSGRLSCLPAVMFNDDGLTLDGVTADAIREAIAERGGKAVICQTSPDELIDALLRELA